MKNIQTKFGSIESFQKGTIEILQGSTNEYAFSNLYDVAKNAKSFERIAIAKNFEYVVEVIKVEGDSKWYVCHHDEFCLVMCGEIEASFIKPEKNTISEKNGAVLLESFPQGQYMGKVIAQQGHMILLPQQCAYKLSANDTSVVIIQTLLGEQTIEKWKDICHSDKQEKCNV